MLHELIKLKTLGEKDKDSRADYGVCDDDVFNADIHLLKVIHNSLCRYSERTCSYPPMMTHDDWDKIVEQGIEDCRYILDKMFEIDTSDEEFEMRYSRLMDFLNRHLLNLWI